MTGRTGSEKEAPVQLGAGREGLAEDMESELLNQVLNPDCVITENLCYWCLPQVPGTELLKPLQIPK